MAKVNKVHPRSTTPDIRTEVPKGIAPKRRAHPGKANSPDVFGKVGPQKAAEGLHRLEATPRAIAGAGRFAASVAGARGPIVTTAAAALGVLEGLNAKSPSAAAAELQRMAWKLLVPNKGSENV